RRGGWRERVQLYVNARTFDIIEHLGEQPTLPARVFFGGTRWRQAITEKNGGLRLLQKAIKKIVPAVFIGEVHHPEIKIAGGIPVVFQQVGRGVDGQLVTLAANGISVDMPLQGIVRDHTDTRAAGGHESTFSRAWASSSWIVLSSSPSWKGLPM